MRGQHQSAVAEALAGQGQADGVAVLAGSVVIGANFHVPFQGTGGDAAGREPADAAVVGLGAEQDGAQAGGIGVGQTLQVGAHHAAAADDGDLAGTRRREALHGAGQVESG